MHGLERDTQSRDWRGLAIPLAVMLLWVWFHPLTTLWHDARIYAILALNWLHPDAYARDPFFMFGSQDSFSLFSVLYGPLIAHLGLRGAHTVIMLIGGILWCIAAVRVTNACIRNYWFAATAALALAALSINYSPNGNTFVLNENFATARTLAFPLGALALAECVQGRWVRAAALSLLAAMLHPLLGVWPSGVALLWPLSWRWRACCLVLAAGVLLALMLSEVGPFVRFDPEWEPIARTAKDVFVWPLSGENTLRWPEYAFHLVLLLLAAFCLRIKMPAAAQLYVLVALVAVSGLLVAMLASYFWPSQLVIQAQLWRSMWLAAYMVPVVLAHLAYLLVEALYPKNGKRHLWLLMMIVTLLLMLRDWPLFALMAVCLIVTGWSLWWRYSDAEQSTGVLARLSETEHKKWFRLLVCGLILIALPAFWRDLWIQRWATPIRFDWIPAELIGFFISGGFGLGFLLLAWGLQRFGQFPFVSYGVAVLLVVALLNWDTRQQNVKIWEETASFGMQEGLREWIKPGDVVLWRSKRMPLETWYDLRTAHYAGGEQSTGMVFSREKTFELIRRVQHIRAAMAFERDGVKDASQDDKNIFAFQMPEGKGIPVLCQDNSLDWVVVSPAGKPTQAGGIPFTYDDGDRLSKTLYLYRCRNFRQGV